jgi:repressor LexA
VTPRQRQVYVAIDHLTAERGYPPTVRELCDRVGMRSSSTVVTKLEALRREGFITWEPVKSRTIKIVKSLDAA